MTTTTPILAEADMRALGFTDRRSGFWYYCTRLGRYETVNFTINKKSGVYEELVMDEACGQPAYYGRMKPEYGIPMRQKVDQIIERLNAAGLTLAVDHRLYGFSE